MVVVVVVVVVVLLLLLLLLLLWMRVVAATAVGLLLLYGRQVRKPGRSVVLRRRSRVPDHTSGRVPLVPARAIPGVHPSVTAVADQSSSAGTTVVVGVQAVVAQTGPRSVARRNGIDKVRAHFAL